MPITYGATHETLKPYTLTEKDLIGIARVVRHFAEIEEIVTLYIGALAKLNESQLVILLGRAALTRRLQMAEQLAALSGSEQTERFASVFTSGFYTTLAMRNAIAHGSLLGVDSAGEIAFLTDKTDQPEGPSTVQVVASYAPETIHKIGEHCLTAAERAAERLKLTPWLKKHRPQALRPHRKAQPRRKGG